MKVTAKQAYTTNAQRMEMSKQDARQQARIAANVDPSEYSAVYTTADGQYRVVQESASGKFYCQERNGAWAWMRKGMFFVQYARKLAAQDYIERFATPAELL
jgi:hypothetical protein